MVILRRIFLSIALALLALFLWALAIDIGVVHFVENPTRVKQVLADSGVYKTVVPTALDQAKSIQIEGNNVSAGNPLIKNAANQAFPPSLIQQDVETVVDSITNWLNGQTSQPDFKIDLSGPKTVFAKDLAAGVQTKLTSLPACTTTTSASIESFNPFTATCLPEGIDTATAASQVQSDVASSNNFLPQSTYTANDIKNADGKPLFGQGQFKSGPSRYQRIKSSPYVIGFIALLLAAAAVFLSSSRRKGLRRVGITLVAIGAIIVALTVLINSASNHISSLSSNIQNRALQTSVNDALKSLVQDLAHTYYVLSGSYIVLGLLAIFVPMFTGRGGRKHPKSTHVEPTPTEPMVHELAHEEEPAEPEPEPTPEPERPSAKPEPKKPPKKIPVS